MGQGANANAEARVELAARIDSLGRELPHLTTRALAFAVDDIRRTARRNRLEAVAALAGGLEQAIAVSGGAVVVLPFLEAMSDAVECESNEPAIAARYLAAVGVRLHG